MSMMILAATMSSAFVIQPSLEISSRNMVQRSGQCRLCMCGFGGGFGKAAPKKVAGKANGVKKGSAGKQGTAAKVPAAAAGMQQQVAKIDVKQVLLFVCM